MSKQSHIYVIAFASGTLKAGRAADAGARLAAHRREAARHGITVTSQWCSGPCSEYNAVRYEQQLLAFCASRGTLRAGQEYFTGLDFHEIQAFAEKLAGPAVHPPIKPRTAKPQSVKKDKSPIVTNDPPYRYMPPRIVNGRECLDEEDDFPGGPLQPALPPPARRPDLHAARMQRAVVDEKYEI